MRFCAGAEALSITPRVQPAPASYTCESRITGRVFVCGRQQSAVSVPDTLVGTDSHDDGEGLGVVVWGLGGIEAEARCGSAISMLPRVRVSGWTHQLEGATANRTRADDTGSCANTARRKFASSSGGPRAPDIADRATLGNMCPDTGDDRDLTNRRKTLDISVGKAGPRSAYTTSRLREGAGCSDTRPAPDPVYSE